jgi:hypothetical protein
MRGGLGALLGGKGGMPPGTASGAGAPPAPPPGFPGMGGGLPMNLSGLGKKL